MIKLQNVAYSYGDHLVLTDVNLTVKSGEFVAIRGSNGTGKSTLLKILLKELNLQEGEMFLFGTPLGMFNDFQKIGYVPQMQVMNAMTFPVTCLEMVMLNLYRDFGWIKIPRRRIKQRAERLLTELGLKEHMHRPVNQLSGGLKQRTMIARALINQPQLLILDEPMTGVDQKSRNQLINILLDLQSNYDLTIILVSHDVQIADVEIPNYHEYELYEGRLHDARV